MLILCWVWHLQRHDNKEWRMEVRLLPWFLLYCHNQTVQSCSYILPEFSDSVVPTTPLKLLLQSCLVYKPNVQFLVIISLDFLWAFHIVPTHFFLEQTLSCFPCPVAVLYFCLLTSLNTSLSSWVFFTTQSLCEDSQDSSLDYFHRRFHLFLRLQIFLPKSPKVKLLA